MSAIGAFAAGAGEGLVTSAFNMFSAEQSRDYNREMASTAHQREVGDLRKAGLNPVLSAGGHGASVAPSPTPQAGNFRATQSAIEAMQLKNQSRLVDAQVRDINSAATLKEIEGAIALKTQSEKVDTIRENLYKLRMDIDMTPLQREQLEKKIEQMGIESDIMKNQRSHSAYDLSKAASESEFYQGFGGEIEHWLKMLGISMPGINLFRGPGSRKSGTGRTTIKSNNRVDHRDSKGYNDFKNRYNNERKLFPEGGE